MNVACPETTRKQIFRPEVYELRGTYTNGTFTAASLLDSINARRAEVSCRYTKNYKVSTALETPEAKAKRLREEVCRKLQVCRKLESESFQFETLQKVEAKHEDSILRDGCHNVRG